MLICRDRNDADPTNVSSSAAHGPPRFAAWVIHNSKCRYFYPYMLKTSFLPLRPAFGFPYISVRKAKHYAHVG